MFVCTYIPEGYTCPIFPFPGCSNNGGGVGGLGPLSFSLCSLSGSSSPVLEQISPARTAAELHTNSLNRRRTKYVIMFHGDSSSSSSSSSFSSSSSSSCSFSFCGILFILSRWLLCNNDVLFTHFPAIRE